MYWNIVINYNIVQCYILFIQTKIHYQSNKVFSVTYQVCLYMEIMDTAYSITIVYIQL